MKGVRTLVRRVKQTKQITAISKLKGVVTDFNQLPRDLIISTFTNQMRLRQQEWIARGDPITPEGMEKEVVEREWPQHKFAYERAGVTLDELLEAGRLALDTPEEGIPLSKPIQFIADKFGRNQKCPCGSGRKYKKCCGKGE